MGSFDIFRGTIHCHGKWNKAFTVKSGGSKMKTKIILMGALFFMLSLGIAGAQLAPAPPPIAQTQVLLPGANIPKFVDQLPVAGPITVVNAATTPNFNIHIKEFQANILPVNAAIPASKGFAGLAAGTPSWVWGYLTEADLTGTFPRPSYLGPVIVAQRHAPAFPTYTNELPVYPAGNVQPLLPVDMTVDWANPLGVNCLPDALGNYTNPTCGQLVYTGPIPTAVHIHGGEVAPAFDGGPDAWITNTGVTGIGFPGNTYTYPNGQQESTIWFHDHAFGVTRLNVYAGLAGIYPIVDSANSPVGMPAFPQHDIPLIIQDRSFDTTGQLFYNLAANPQPNPTVHPFWIPEFIGDVIVVNGKTWPNLNVEPRQYRFRLLNGSNARHYDLSMTKGLPFIAIATDGGYLQSAVSTPSILIAPGERYEAVVDFSALAVGTKVVMKNAARMPYPGGAKPTLNGTDTVMQFTVVANTSGLPNTAIAAGTVLRSATNPIQPIINGFVAGTNITRQLTLNEILGAGGPLELVLNNSKFNLNLNTPGCPGAVSCRETELPAIGDTEIWEIINITADAHPIHTHLVTFQILDRTPFQSAKWVNQYDAALLANGKLPGQGPPNAYNVKNADGAIGGNPPINALLQLKSRKLPLPYEKGWKDTAVMMPGEVTRIVVRWAPTDVAVGGVAVGQNLYPFDPTALIGGVGYVWHCHIIDHEDNEMMRNYTVMPTRQPIQ
jgi:spore coat protein A, manganese oxidase